VVEEGSGWKILAGQPLRTGGGAERKDRVKYSLLLTSTSLA